MGMKKYKKRQMNNGYGDGIAVKGLQIFTFIIKTSLVCESHQNSNYKKKLTTSYTDSNNKKTMKIPSKKVQKCAFDFFPSKLHGSTRLASVRQ